jgi:hypothetical protein
MPPVQSDPGFSSPRLKLAGEQNQSQQCTIIFDSKHYLTEYELITAQRIAEDFFRLCSRVAGQVQGIQQMLIAHVESG